MKSLFVLFLITLTSTSAFAARKTMPDFNAPKDMTDGCAEAIVAKLMADDEVGHYLDKKMTVSLEWNDDEKKVVSFNFNFDVDVRDGYMLGEIAVQMKSGGYCVVGKVLNSSVGD